MSNPVFRALSKKSPGRRWRRPVLLLPLACLMLFGLTGCPEQGIEIAAAQELIRQRQDLVLLDVRTPKEFDAGHLAGAVNENFHAGEFEQKLARFDRAKTYLVYCQSGARSRKTLALMQRLGFKQVYMLGGGIERWQAQGQPVKRAPGGQKTSEGSSHVRASA